MENANKKYELVAAAVTNTYMVRALRDFGDVKAGDLGGFVDGEHNLSHEGDCWIYADAWVHQNAKVYGNARVYGSAHVFGDARIYGDAVVSGSVQIEHDARVFGTDRVTKSVITFGDRLYRATLTDNHLNIGDKQHTLKYWLEHYREMGRAAGLSASDIARYGRLLRGLVDTEKGRL